MSTRAVKLPASGSKSTSACSKPSQRWANGNHVLYTDSFAQNSSRSQQMPGAAVARSFSRARSVSLAMRSSIPSSGSGSLGSASIPSDRISRVAATTAARYPSQWVMEPTTPAGHRGAPRGPESTGTGGTPSLLSAVRAQVRAVANSCRLAGTAPATMARSSGKSTAAGSSANASAAATGAGSIRSIIRSHSL
jgi:hypothetical protein